jgi:hypothetical protein
LGSYRKSESKPIKLAAKQAKPVSRSCIDTAFCSPKLTELSHFSVFEAANHFRISEGYRRSSPQRRLWGGDQSGRLGSFDARRRLGRQSDAELVENGLNILFGLGMARQYQPAAI